ncbi:vegetative incompatibility protein HET-E-1 [Rhizoctonia solani 123E]|uniref:Vegetative incompatibility protein HET-E-1 n=2 Tax=Rhizoctonia solani TaxID=456999 RepID=A0A074S0N5_9AGAM|nr:vegetative incompatibility protein HET-E-1 [Rhizoctonia solani 123E]
MSSEHPPGSPGKRGMRQSLRVGFHRAKDALIRPVDTTSPIGHQASATVPSLGSQLLSVFTRSNRALVRAPSPAELDRGAIAASSGPSTQASVVEAQDKATTSHRKSDNAAWNRLLNTLGVLENSVELFPPLKSAVGALIGCLDIVQKAASNRADYEELADEFQSLANMVSQYSSDLELEPNNGSIANIAQCIQQQVTDIEQKEASGTVGRLLDATQDQEDVIRRYRQVERLFQQLQYDLSMRTRSDVKKHLEMALLQRMSAVDDAKYNSSYSNTIRRHRCTAKTRETIHQALQGWSTDPESAKIYWMNGMAGTGKTTIAYSFCEWLEKTNRLGASFFCSRISSTCRSLSQIVPTLAYQVARFSPAFRSSLCSVLNNDPDAGKLNVVQQFEKLIYQPMLATKGAIPDIVVVVIDALDECDDNYSVRLLLDTLLKFAEHLPLKFFVSSRPEPVIRGRMMSRGGSSRFIVYLHDIEESIVEDDIKKYLTEALSSMEPSPSVAQIGLLAKRSRNLFIYAATLVRYIYPDDVSVDSTARLESMLEAISSAKAMFLNRYEDLDLLYTTVLNAVFKKRLEEGEKDHMQRVLWTVVCAREPVTTVTIASLAMLTERQVSSALQPLRSVIHVPESSNLISTLHASFPEYMMDESRSKEFCCNESKSNERMTHRCFDVMKLELKFNICALENSYIPDDQVADLKIRVAECISPTLSYACQYWASHLRVAPATDNTRTILLDFLSNRLLFWMEVLSLSHCIGIGAPMMQQAQTWLRVGAFIQISDARNFVTWFAANPCSRSTPHIYISALPLCAKSSWVYQHYVTRTTGLVNISISQHDEAVLAIWSLESPVESVAISPDGNRIANGSDDGRVQVYDMHTGAVVAGPFEGHSRIVWSVAFSPDGRYIASGSYDETVIVWDAHTGRIVTGPLHKHTGLVRSVSFSPDGKRVASGSSDKTIIVWDTYTGAIALGPLEGHFDYIMSVAFSPDGQFIASGSDDQTIRLWDASTGTAVAKPLKGHTGQINRVAFSPDGSKLASCSYDRTIRVWDIKAGTTIGSPFTGHKGGVWSIAFSHDGRWIASGGVNEDHNIIVWDTLTGSVVLGPLFGHTSYVGSVMFTPDNSRITSCSDDKTIRIWDVQPETRTHGWKSPRELPVGPVAFLRNHTQFISSSSSSLLRLWDMHTGMTVPREFEAYTEVGMFHSITVSPQDTLVAVGANDLTVRVWIALNGKLVCQPLKGHKDLVRCLDFSPDGAQLCIGSDDATIAVWNIDTGTIVESYIGHTEAVTSVAFSPNAACIVSGSVDCTLRIWDTSTGTLVHTLNGHNTSVSSVAFAPNGNHIVSGSVDGAICRWDVRAGTPFDPTYGPDTGSDSDSGSNSSRDKFSSVNWVCFSLDSTRIISGFGSSLCLVDAHTMKLISKLSLPQSEKVRWVGYSPDGMDIISVSIHEEANTQELADEATQLSPDSPKIIRVWRTGAQPDRSALPATPHDWSYEPDGRVISPEGLVMWIPPDLIPYMKAHTELGSRSYYSPLVLSSDEFIDIGHQDLCIGARWMECYTHKR